jgi:hypothetical protein
MPEAGDASTGGDSSSLENEIERTQRTDSDKKTRVAC